VSYRETVNKFNKKILKWYVAIPLGFVAYMISNALGGVAGAAKLTQRAT